MTGGKDVFQGFANDPSVLVDLDLVGGVGGYTNVADVMSALTPDGGGGSLLPIGAAQSSTSSVSPRRRYTSTTFRPDNKNDSIASQSPRKGARGLILSDGDAQADHILAPRVQRGCRSDAGLKEPWPKLGTHSAASQQRGLQILASTALSAIDADNPGGPQDVDPQRPSAS